MVANESWLPGVRQRGAQLSATLHRVVDRPRLSQRTDGIFDCRSSTAGARCVRKPGDQKSSIKNPVTTEYPANGSSNLPHIEGEENYGQASRLISTSQLNASLRFHTWPINLVVYQEPLGALWLGRSHLVEGFTLRCLQRFSLPDVATRHCRWRDNRYTRGPSNPVLSY